MLQKSDNFVCLFFSSTKYAAFNTPPPPKGKKKCLPRVLLIATSCTNTIIHVHCWFNIPVTPSVLLWNLDKVLTSSKSSKLEKKCLVTCSPLTHHVTLNLFTITHDSLLWHSESDSLTVHGMTLSQNTDTVHTSHKLWHVLKNDPLRSECQVTLTNKPTSSKSSKANPIPRPSLLLLGILTHESCQHCQLSWTYLWQDHIHNFDCNGQCN